MTVKTFGIKENQPKQQQQQQWQQHGQWYG